MPARHVPAAQQDHPVSNGLLKSCVTGELLSTRAVPVPLREGL